MAKGSSGFAVGNASSEVAGEYRRVVARPGSGVAAVRQMQRKLYQWAIEDSDRRFDDVFNLVCDPSFQVVAWDRVRSNRGSRSAGIDGVAPRQVSARSGRMLVELREELKTRRGRR
jgi:RNA-directed DNA polymerase